jgi:hypothetical protein
MHPDIVRALMNEHVCDLTAAARSSRRSRLGRNR